MNYLSLFSTIATLFLLLACGYIAGKLNIIDEVARKKLSKLVVSIGQPFLIISSITNVEYTKKNLVIALIILVLGFLQHSFMALYAYFAAKPFKDLDERKIIEFSLVFANAGFIGFPILKSLMGDIGLFYGAFYIMSFHIFIWTRGIAILARGRSDIKLTLKGALINYGTVPCFIGFAWFMTGLSLPAFFADFAGYLAEMCTPISVMITGALLSTKALKEIFAQPKVYYLSLHKLLLLPMLVCIIMKLVGAPENIIMFSTIVAAMPTGAVASMMCELYDISPAFASQGVGTTSLLTTVALPIVILVMDFVIKNFPTIVNISAFLPQI